MDIYDYELFFQTLNYDVVIYSDRYASPSGCARFSSVGGYCFSDVSFAFLYLAYVVLGFYLRAFRDSMCGGCGRSPDYLEG